jgi:feruloyl esterase
MFQPYKKMLWIAWLALNGLGLASASDAQYSRCKEASLAIPGVTINLVEHHKEGTIITLPDVVPSCRGPNLNVTITNDLCRVVMEVSTSNSSSIRVEAWLPDDWNERFLATGNGGIGGCIDYDTMQNGAQLGFASFGTNAGHDGETGHDFFLNQPEVINDFGHRAIHVEAQVGKEIVGKFYNKEDFTSYYQGCSTGGRQGFQTAQMYPEDFDGILLGAPAVDWLHIVASKGILARRIGWPDLDSKEYVRPEQWTAIVEKQVEMFDSLDGVEDGMIDNPSDFHFDAELLACGTGALDEHVCLSPDQVLSVQRAYQPLTDSDGNIVYPGFDLGANTNVFSANQVNGTAQLAYRVLDVSVRYELVDPPD